MENCVCLCEFEDHLSSDHQEALPLAYLQCAVVAPVCWLEEASAWMTKIFREENFQVSVLGC